MKENKVHTQTSSTLASIQPPLHDFFATLKRNNFLVTPKRITEAHLIIKQYSDKIRDELELADYLSPLFANDKDEQVQFKELFEKFYIPEEQKSEEPIKPDWLKILLLFLLGLLMALPLFLWVKGCGSGYADPKISVKAIVGDKSPDNLSQNVRLDISVQNPPEDYSLQTETHWGDITTAEVDTSRTHAYNKTGFYIIETAVELHSGLIGQYLDTTLYSEVSICLVPASLTIERSFKEDSIRVNREFSLVANIIGKKPDSILWLDTDLNPLRSAKDSMLITSVSQKGKYRFFAKAFYNEEETVCTIQEETSFYAYDFTPTSVVTFNQSANSKPIVLPIAVHWPWFLVFGGSTIVFLLLRSFFHRKYQKGIDTSSDCYQEAYDNLLQSFSGKMGSIDLPLHDKNFLPVPEPEVDTIAKSMRERKKSSAMYLHVGKTISNAVHNAGYFQPVMEARTGQSEFLILIDHESINDQQTRLFEFLIELLQKRNVHIEKFYYSQSLRTCYRKNKTRGIKIKKLSERYSDYILLIFGNAYELLHPMYPSIDRDLMLILEHWEYKAIMTPVSYLDWGVKESEALIKNLHVLPVDIEGQLLLMKSLLEEDVDLLRILDQYYHQFYEVAMVNFESIDELLNYCKQVPWANRNGSKGYKNILFQWIAALAVYPKISWELILAIGKELLDTHGLETELNFTTLLRIARIKWINSGRFPDFIRLELLKRLSKDHEILARETVLHLLDEITDAELNPTHFAYEEKETQRLIQEFNLYAYDSVRYSAYRESKQLFKRLNEDQLVTDMVAKSYMENPDLEWETLIHSTFQGIASSTTRNVPLKKYLSTDSENDFTKRLLFWAKWISTFFMTAGALGTLFLLYLHLFGKTPFSPLTYIKKEAQNIRVQYTEHTNEDDLENFLFLIDSNSINKANLISVGISSNDAQQVSSWNFRVPILANDSVRLVRFSRNGTILLDTSMVIKYNSYDLNLSYLQPPKDDSDLDGVIGLEDDCPEEKGPAENRGCPWPDSDEDGTPDKDDDCLEEEGPAENKGCPWPDKDKDGVPDKDDNCPDIAGLEKFDGCLEPVAVDEVDELDTYKIGFYSYPEQQTIVDNLIKYIVDEGFKGTYEYYPVDNDFYFKVDRPKGFEIRYDADTELKVARTLRALLNGQPSEHRFYIINVGTPTPGFISVFVPFYSEGGDFDGDGVPDLDDNCPKDQGLVRRNGCPYITRGDRDGDGILDTNDECKDEFGPEENGGCPIGKGGSRNSNDSLLIKQSNFQQPPTIGQDSPIRQQEQRDNRLNNNNPSERENQSNVGPSNVQEGELLDSDGDRVPDAYDKCPNLTGDLKFDGCPSRISRKDNDGDGIQNKVDSCPDEAGLPELNGCPDTDGDGIPDKDDACPDGPGLVSQAGCPETDGDGVVDKDDECPNEPGPAENNGCPWGDRDGDSVLDKDDACPDVAGTVANTGCPEVTEEVQKQLNDYASTILFDTNKSSIKAESEGVFVDILHVLNDYSGARFIVEGHTDNVGSPKTNQQLSESRAIAVRDFLIKAGIDPNRLTAVGYGEDKPIASNNTRAGRAQNRRVEINLLY